MNDKLQEFYAEVDGAVRRLESIHEARLRCAKGCSSCCVDEITVVEVEAENIRDRHGDLLEGSDPHRKGACAFLDEGGACRIYEDRPYVCRTQGLPLRWLEETDEGFVEYRDICPLNDETGEPVETLPEDDCWTIGGFEGWLAQLQSAANGKMMRVPLRSLFRSAEPGDDETAGG